MPKYSLNYHDIFQNCGVTLRKEPLNFGVDLTQNGQLSAFQDC